MRQKELRQGKNLIENIRLNANLSKEILQKLPAESEIFNLFFRSFTRMFFYQVNHIAEGFV
jgi:hypothetical protein